MSEMAISVADGRLCSNLSLGLTGVLSHQQDMQKADLSVRCPAGKTVLDID